MVWWMAAMALADEAPDGGVVITLNAYGEIVVGHAMVDADALAKLGITLKREELPMTGPQVPLAHGMRVLGLAVGERQVQKAIDALMYFNLGDDPYLDAADPAFPALSLFVDRDGDKQVDAGEVRTLADLGVESISRFGDIRMKER